MQVPFNTNNPLLRKLRQQFYFCLSISSNFTVAYSSEYLLKDVFSLKPYLRQVKYILFRAQLYD